MVEVKESLDVLGNVQIQISDPEKSKVTYTVHKTNDGFAFYAVRMDKGVVPKELSSSYTKLEDAEKAVIRYLSKQKMSPTLRRDKNTEEREKRKESA